MALTTADLQTQLAYRLGETVAPSDSTTKSLRLEWMNQGYFNIARRHNWWWLEATDTSNTNTGATSYALPADYKKVKELKIGTIFYDEIPFEDNRIYVGTSAIVSLPYVTHSYKFYIYADHYYLLPIDGNDGATHTIHYYKRLTAKVIDGGTFLIPDEYLECVVAYAEARYWLSITQQAKAVVPFQEYEEIVKEMEVEQGRRSSGSSGYQVLDPEDAL